MDLVEPLFRRNGALAIGTRVQMPPPTAAIKIRKAFHV
jgi:hypothetical protein